MYAEIQKEPKPSVQGMLFRNVGSHWEIGAHIPVKSRLDNRPSQFTFVGGGIEPGESKDAAMRRELEEEYSCSFADCCAIYSLNLEPFLHECSDTSLKLISWFIIEVVDNTINPSIDTNEVYSFKWWSIAELEPLLQCLTPGKREMIQEIIGDRTTVEHLFL